MKFDNWLDTFLSEKGIQGNMFEVEHNGFTHFIEQEVLIDFIKSSPKEHRNKIKSTLVKIDFKNGDCLHFLNHLAKGFILATS